MPRLLFALAIVMAALLQASLLPRLLGLQIRPNVVLVLVLLWTVARGPREGSLWAFGIGLLLDLATLAPVGTHALGLLGVVAVGTVSRTPRFRLGVLPPMLAALVGTIVHDTIILVAQREWAILAPSLLRLSLLSGILNLMVTPLLLLVTSALHRWQTRLEETIGRPQRPSGPPPRL